MKHTYVVLLLGIILLAYSGCDDGLAPVPPTTGFGGTIYFRNWPRIDSVDAVVWELRITAFREVPSDTTGIIIELARGNVLVYPQFGQTAFAKRDSTGRLRDSIQYAVYLTTELDKLPKSYKYIAMAWRFSPNVFVDWRPAGIYASQPYGFIPTTITIRKDIFVEGVDIYCDFRNPPPRPWR